jgi:hypothetical protein
VIGRLAGVAMVNRSLWLLGELVVDFVLRSDAGSPGIEQLDDVRAVETRQMPPVVRS